jgi:serine/threonine protein kinase
VIPVLGALLGNYRVVEELAEGGMGVVYIGRHETLGRRVVVKVLLPELSRNADMVQRFFNEAQAATAIRNAGIAQVFDFGTTEDGRAYIVMELLQGESLAVRLERRRVELVECCRIGRQVANVLAAAHAAGITHRDLKPDNLFLVPDPEVIGGERVKVLDFGIAKIAGEAHASGVKTRTGLIMGSPAYMSPEQCRSFRTADARSDIYSLGCILFEMACGRPPFVSEGMGDIVGAHLHVPPPHPQELVPSLSPGLSGLLMNMLAKPPAARPQTMTEVSQVLDELLQLLESAPARPSGPPVPLLVSASGPAPIPASGPAPMQVSVPQISPTAETLRPRAGQLGGPRPAGTRRFPLVLAGLIVAGAVTAIVIVLAIRGSRSGERQISYDDIESAPKAVDAAVIEDTAAAPEAAADTAVSPTASGDLEAECQALEAERKWAELEQCADRLAPADPKRAAELKTRAVEETRSAPRIAAVEAALRDRNLRRARSELEQVWPESVEYAAIKRKYDAAAAQAVADLAVQLERVKDSDCEEYNAVLAKERATKPTQILDAAVRRIPCTPPPCLAQAYADKGQQQYAAGQLAAALASYESAYACRAAPQWSEKAFVIACNLKQPPKAKLHWRRLTPEMRARSVTICVRNGITDAVLNAP